MGNAYYNTPAGEAGYGVLATCDQDACTEKIDRGLSYLCGGTPGQADEYGCGQWFCSKHLYLPRVLPVEAGVGGLCDKCLAGALSDLVEIYMEEKGQ